MANSALSSRPSPPPSPTGEVPSLARRRGSCELSRQRFALILKYPPQSLRDSSPVGDGGAEIGNSHVRPHSGQVIVPSPRAERSYLQVGQSCCSRRERLRPRGNASWIRSLTLHNAAMSSSGPMMCRTTPNQRTRVCAQECPCEGGGPDQRMTDRSSSAAASSATGLVPSLARPIGCPDGSTCTCQYDSSHRIPRVTCAQGP